MAPELGRGCDLLLTGGCVLTVDDDRRVLDPGAVAITGDRIVAVGPAAEFRGWQAKRTIDCANRLVAPGFVDGHTHLFQALGRGLGEGLSIWPWLSEFMWPYSIAIGAGDARLAATVSLIEAARSGITCVVDNHYAPTDGETTLAIAGTIEAVGLRGAVARGILGRRSPVADQRGLPAGLFRYSTDEELAITRACMQARPPGSRVEVWPAPLNLAYCDQDVVRRSAVLAREFGTRWHTHCSESQRDPASYLAAYQIRPVEWLAREGLLDGSATLAHAIWLDDAEIAHLAGAGAGVAHNPISNAYLASGTIRLRDLRAGGVAVSLGTDGPSTGHRQDMFECMKQALFLQRMSSLDPAAARCEDALELATREGARYAGIDAGVLAPGKLADVVVICLDRPHLRPVNRAVATLVYSARGSDVDTTIVGGQLVVEGGRCTRLDEQAVLAEVQQRADRFIPRAGFDQLRSTWIK